MAQYKVLETRPIGEDIFITLGEPDIMNLEEKIGNISTEATTITMPIEQRNTKFEDAIQAMTRQFTDTIRALTIDRPTSRKRSTSFQQTFSGEKYEDPEIFLKKLNKYFENVEIEEEDEKITIFENQLRGEAKIWRTPYQRLEESYQEVCQRFLNHFNSAEKILAAMSSLYGDKQKNENATSFIIYKQGLMARLVPKMKNETKADLILNQLNCDIRSRLRGARFKEVEELMIAAKYVEEDLIE